MNERFSRGRFAAAGLGALASPAIFRVAARAAQFEFKLGTADAPESPVVVRLNDFAEAVKTESGGRVQISIFPNSQLGSVAAMLSQVRLGSIQFLATSHTYFSALAPVAQIGSTGFAFTSAGQALSALDGPLGAYMRKEIEAKGGLHVFERTLDLGFREISTSTKPIANAEDFNGFKVRVTAAPILIDLLKTLGAAPVTIDPKELYTALETHLVDGQDVTLIGLESFKLYEVQKYLSMTNHIWGGEWIVMTGDAWNGLPGDLKGVLERNASKYALLERRDTAAQNAQLAAKLQGRGMVINTPNTAAMRSRLGSYYAKWKAEFGPQAWSLLEAAVGKLG